MNILLVSVTERTREIGLRLALGARGSDILVQFLIESLVMCAIGGLVGIGVGLAGSEVLGAVTGWSTVVSPQAVALAIGFSAAVGLFFGFYPARRRPLSIPSRPCAMSEAGRLSAAIWHASGNHGDWNAAGKARSRR